MVRFLYYKYPALVKPFPKAFKPSRPLHVRYGLAPSGRFYLRASSLKISLPCEEATDRKAVLLALVIAALCPFPFKREGSHESLPEPPSPDCQTARHPHNVLATAAACPQHDHRPLVIRCTHNFAGAMLYCSSLRMRLRRR